MTFEKALKELKSGKKIIRKSISTEWFYTNLKYIYFDKKENLFVGVYDNDLSNEQFKVSRNFTLEDILANDWEIYQDI